MLNLILAQLVFGFLPVSGPGLGVPVLKADLKVCPTSWLSETTRLEHSFGAGIDIPVTTGRITAFAAAADPTNRILVAVASPDSLLSIFSSEDQGRTWQPQFTLRLGSVPTQLELLVPGTGNSPVLFVFCLVPENYGDLFLLRIAADFSQWVQIPLATGPDTIDDFSVAIDREESYYLYCLFVNEHRTGKNGAFTRSLDQGFTWEMPQDFYNCFDPCLSFGSGSVLHCIWRYGLNGREIHYSQNRHYGAPARWDWLRVLSATGEKCFHPVVAQAETSPPWRAPVWAVWTVARRDTEMLDVVVSCSNDGGNSFSSPQNLGEMFVDEWFPDLSADNNSACLVYNAGGKGANDPTVIYWRYCRPWSPQVWSAPLIMNDARANALFEAARPRVVPGFRFQISETKNRGLITKNCFDGVLFSYYRPEYAWGLYFDQPFPMAEPIHHLLPPATLVDTENRQFIFDVLGRRVFSQKLLPGVYFIYEKKRSGKLVVIKNSAQTPDRRRDRGME